jgi:PAS domain S-box-containing protein
MTSSNTSVFHAGGGIMGAKLRALDWSKTSLGPLTQWSGAMRVAVDLMMSSDFPSCLFWGQDLVAIYNNGFLPILGEKTEALGQPMRVTWQETWEQLKPIAQKALDGESTYIEDFMITIDRHGYLEDAYFTFCYSPVRDEQGTIVGILDTVTETTAQVTSRRTAISERERLQALLQQMPAFAAVLNGPAHTFQYVNDAYIELSGSRNFLGRSVRDVFPEIAGQGFFEMLDNVYATGQSMHAKAFPIELDGEKNRRFIDLLYEPIRDAKGVISGIFVGGYDITERVKAESGLQLLNSELERKVVERSQVRGMTWQVSPDLLGALNSNGYFKTSNPAWQTVLGWTEAEVASMSIFEMLHPDDVERTRRGFNLTQEGEPAIRFPNRYRCKDGSYRWISWVGVPEDGLVYCSGRDITDEVMQADMLRHTEEALRQSQKMDALGQLTGGIAHDFNNMLQGIVMPLQLIAKRVEAERYDGLERYVQAGLESARRAASVTQRLLAFSRRQPLTNRLVEVGSTLLGIEDILKNAAGENILLSVKLEHGLWNVLTDAHQFESAIINLVINARDALPDGGSVVLSAQNVRLSEAEARLSDGLCSNDYVRVDVRDDGVGMPADVLAKVFEPFFTTKPMGQGTGLGLSMIYGYARQSKGTVCIESVEGSGTCVQLFLPRASAPQTPDTESLLLPLIHAVSPKCVLVVEDDEVVRRMVVELLRDHGYLVLEAGDGAAGMALLEGSIPVDLLLSDVGLPGPNGRQLADFALAHLVDIKIILMTGYAAHVATDVDHLNKDIELIVKPFDADALLRLINVVLMEA